MVLSALTVRILCRNREVAGRIMLLSVNFRTDMSVRQNVPMSAKDSASRV